MKELMLEIKTRFFAEVRERSCAEDGFRLSPEEVEEIYERISSEVYLEKLSQMMDRK